jgi:hypothetical protein
MKRMSGRAIASGLVAFALLPATAEAQAAGGEPDASYFLGYSVNLPHQEVGFAYGRIRKQRWGLYVDVKVSVGVPGSASNDYLEDITVPIAEAWGHTLRATKTGYFSLNVGTTRRVGSRLTVYGGVGLCAVQDYSQYYDASLLLGVDGTYWIDGAEEDVRSNFMLGALIPVTSSALLQVGAESLPRGVTVGLHWRPVGGP